jgi:hypothetical protein
MEDLESEKWKNWKYAILYLGDKAIGYCITDNEADAICEKISCLQWDFGKKINQNMPLMVSSEIDLYVELIKELDTRMRNVERIVK